MVADELVEPFTMNQSRILTLSCRDRPGVVHAVSGLLLRQGANIEEAAQFHDTDTGLFFMRVQCSGSKSSLNELRAAFEELATPLEMRWRIHETIDRMRAVLFVSKEGHCLNDILFRCQFGHLPIEVCAVISNHRVLQAMVDAHGIPFHHFNITPESKGDEERAQLDIVEGYRAELVVLARYMQVLSAPMCAALAGRAINIHHSFLPSFKGARPYQQAHDRGVKLIGATAHYVTSTLDEGPIIEQDVARVDHSMTVEDLAALGRDTECSVLARAVKWHSEHRVLIDGGKTVVFA